MISIKVCPIYCFFTFLLRTCTRASREYICYLFPKRLTCGKQTTFSFSDYSICVVLIFKKASVENSRFFQLFPSHTVLITKMFFIHLLLIGYSISSHLLLFSLPLRLRYLLKSALFTVFWLCS